MMHPAIITSPEMLSQPALSKLGMSLVLLVHSLKSLLPQVLSMVGMWPWWAPQASLKTISLQTKSMR